MPGFSSYDDLILETTTNGKYQVSPFFKTSTAPEAAGQMHSLWKIAGLPGPGANPATTPGTSYSNATGSIYLSNQASDLKFLLGLQATASTNCSLIIYDRLVGVSGISVASTGDKTINSTTLPRYTSGEGVEAWLEVTTASTATAGVMSMNSYTDSDNNTGNAGNSITWTAAAQNVDSLFMLPLAAGDRGVKACSTINVSTATTGGVVNFLLVKRLATIPLLANIGTIIDFTRGFPPMPQLFDGASICLAFVSSGTTAPTLQGSLLFGWG